MFVIRLRNIFYGISGAFVVASFIAIFFFGLNFGIDFKGGSLVEVSYPSGRPDISLIRENIGGLGLTEFSARPTGEQNIIVRTSYLSEEERIALLSTLKGQAEDFQEIRFSSVGPSVGSELARNAIISLSLVILAVVAYVAFAFRHVSEPVSSWKYGVITVVALLHDVIIPTGVFAVLGYIFEYQIDTLFITALLVILGYSINDTIVVFDRVRENLKLVKDEKVHEPFEETVGRGIGQTFGRSINTSLTTLLALIALYIFGSEVTENFALVLIIGIAAGTYSSIFIASPLLVTIERWSVSTRTGREA